jgi:uncharacterized protein (DUF1810 family)
VPADLLQAPPAAIAAPLPVTDQRPDIYNLNRFELSQGVPGRGYEEAKQQLQGGNGGGVWMKYIFPSMGSQGEYPHWAIGGLGEAQMYLEDTVLSERLQECCQLVLDSSRSVEEIFGEEDADKFRASMTLFTLATENVPMTAIHEFFLKCLRKCEGGPHPAIMDKCGLIP